MKNRMELQPVKLSMKKSQNVPIGLVLPGFTSMDHRSLCLQVLQKYKVQIHFELVRMEGKKFVQSKFNDPECIGHALVVEGRNIIKGIEIADAEWPFVGRRLKYMEGIKMAIFPLNEKLELHKKPMRKAKERNMDVVMCMHADYQHSRTKVEDGGGAVYHKFARGVGSCAQTITKKDGTKTTLRELVMEFKDPKTGKQRVAGMCPMPAKEDA